MKPPAPVTSTRFPVISFDLHLDVVLQCNRWIYIPKPGGHGLGAGNLCSELECDARFVYSPRPHTLTSSAGVCPFHGGALTCALRKQYGQRPRILTDPGV